VQRRWHDFNYDEETELKIKKKIALVAHDERKEDLLAWVKFNLHKNRRVKLLKTKKSIGYIYAHTFLSFRAVRFRTALFSQFKQHTARFYCFLPCLAKHLEC
jgi:hypothetical protein